MDLPISSMCSAWIFGLRVSPPFIKGVTTWHVKDARLSSLLDCSWALTVVLPLVIASAGFNCSWLSMHVAEWATDITNPGKGDCTSALRDIATCDSEKRIGVSRTSWFCTAISVSVSKPPMFFLFSSPSLHTVGITGQQAIASRAFYHFWRTKESI